MNKGEVAIHYCPTAEMLADFFTKPLQGRLFHKFRNVIMGWQHISTLQNIDESVLKERVEMSMNPNIVSSVSSHYKIGNRKGEKTNLTAPPRSHVTWNLVKSNMSDTNEQTLK